MFHLDHQLVIASLSNVQLHVQLVDTVWGWSGGEQRPRRLQAIQGMKQQNHSELFLTQSKGEDVGLGGKINLPVTFLSWLPSKRYTPHASFYF